jgi:hypothetical protein
MFWDNEPLSGSFMCECGQQEFEYAIICSGRPEQMAFIRLKGEPQELSPLEYVDAIIAELEKGKHD